MKIELQELENSKVYVSKNDTYKFKHPMDYLSPFMDKLASIGGEVSVQVESEITNGNREDNDVNTAYGRVAMIYKLPSAFDTLPAVPHFNELYKEIGMVYAFDTQKPQLKVFRGNRVSVCTNQCVFGADNVTAMLFQSGKNEVLYDAVQKYVDTAMNEVEKYKETIEMLANQQMNLSQLKEHIGDLAMYAKKNKNLGITCVSDMLTYMMDEKSKYYAGEAGCDKWLTYNALTESIKKVSVLDEVDKVLLLEKIFLPKETKGLVLA